MPRASLSPRTSHDLQIARLKASKRCLKIGHKIMQEAGVGTWEFHERGLKGRAWAKQRHICCPKPTTRRRLYILAHECAHVALQHNGSKPAHRKEFEAELYAHDALRRHGIAVPRKESVRAREYVARRVDQAVRIGKAKELDREAVMWCAAYHGPATKAALSDGTVRLVDRGARNCGAASSRAVAKSNKRNTNPRKPRRRNENNPESA